MDYGEAKFILAKFLSGKMSIVSSLAQPGDVCQFRSMRKGDQRAGYLKHKKYRTVSVAEGRIIGRKHYCTLIVTLRI